MSELDTRTRESIIFEDPSLLRATDAFHALQCFGALFRTNVGSAETYALSEPVSTIDAFISHTWLTERSEKYLALTLYFNLREALLAAAFGAAFAALLGSLKVLPTFQMHPKLYPGQVSVSSRITGTAVFFLMWFLGHEVKGRLGCSGPRLFVDKAVIHQTDIDLKREGIRHLAGFLAHTDRMIIVYSPEAYLKRLWTVYELASMLVLQPIDRIVVIPAFLPKLVLWTSPLWLFFSVLHSLVRTERVWGFLSPSMSEFTATTVTQILFCIPFIPIVFMQRHWGRHCERMRNSMEHFSIQSTECTCEGDRPLVFGNIASFMRDFALADPSASEAEALEAFNAFVRAQLHMVFATFSGHATIPYKYVVVLFLAQILNSADDLACCLNGMVRSACIWAVYDATCALAALPSIVLLCQWCLRDIHPARCTLKLLGSSCFAFALITLLVRLARWSSKSNGWLLAFLSMVAAWFSVTAFLYQPRTMELPPARIPTLVLRQRAAQQQARDTSEECAHTG